jgi:hypothetical protein
MDIEICVKKIHRTFIKKKIYIYLQKQLNIWGEIF